MLIRIKVPNKIKISFEYICAFLLIVFCNFWIYKARPVTPMYYFYFISLLMIPALLILKKEITLSRCQILSIICSLYAFLTLVITSTEWQYTVHTAVAISFFVIAILYLKYLNKKEVLSITNWLYIFSTIYISCETYWRITHPMLSRAEVEADTSNFYMFKCNSFIASDSNGVALMSMTFLFLAYYLYKYVDKKPQYLLYIIIHFIIVIFSFSRSAWIATIIGAFCIFAFEFIKKHLLILKNKEKLTLKLTLFIFTVPVISVIFLIWMFSLLMQDGSFLTKIDLAKSILTFFEKTSLQQLIFGIGSSLELSSKLYGKYPHSMILTYLTWFGVLGSTLICIFWGMIIKATNGKGWIILIPHILAGFAFTAPNIQIFYVAFALMYYFEYILPKKERIENAISVNNSSNI